VVFFSTSHTTSHISKPYVSIDVHFFYVCVKCQKSKTCKNFIKIHTAPFCSQNAALVQTVDCQLFNRIILIAIANVGQRFVAFQRRGGNCSLNNKEGRDIQAAQGSLGSPMTHGNTHVFGKGSLYSKLFTHMQLLFL